MSVVVFDVAEFLEYYPQFASYSNKQLELFFRYGERLCNNTKTSKVKNIEERKDLLYLLVCHFATLAGRDGQVGTTASATEGSVSVSFNIPHIPNAEFFTQTQCGLTYWQMTVNYRLGGYYITPRR